ncbi:MAG: CDP-diacylglycerol--glycerol-3-phosphate 3-phosphatidyltransferase [Treponema sp.]|nr:CDP-diacylglycerol--glycerol-3-phosphate 3-phosphatidyltransferase [Treponema sp.]
MKTSNKFTLVRIVSAPFFFVLYFLPLWFHAENGSLLSIITTCILIPSLAFAEFTDFLDGHFARKNNEVGDFGKMFDPFADVFLHLSLFTCFTFTGYCPLPVLVLVIYREFAQNFLRMIAAKKGVAIAARKGGKLKTVFYITSILISLAIESLARTGLAASWGLDLSAARTVNVCFYVASVVFSYVSFFDYLKSFGHLLKEDV